MMSCYDVESSLGCRKRGEGAYFAFEVGWYELNPRFRWKIAYFLCGSVGLQSGKNSLLWLVQNGC